MEFLKTLALTLCLVTNSHADLPTAAEWLGGTDAFVDTCVQLNPTQAEEYRKHFKSLLNPDATEAELIQARQTAGYRETYQSVISNFNQAPKEEVAKKACPLFFELHP